MSKDVQAISPNLTLNIVQHLGVAVVSGKYSKRNPFFFEADLCRQYGASRPVLREAVKMLTAKGLLRARPRLGTWVQPQESWNLLDPDVLHWLLEREPWLDLLVESTQVRLAIEPAAAALAARVAPRAEKAAIQQALARMIAAERGDDDPLESDIAFHIAILEASGSRFFVQLRELVRTALRFSIRISNRRKGGVRLAGVADHKKIADAIIAGAPEAAANSMRALIQALLDLISEEGASKGRRSR
jgi:DNA-binding FadR family transcriptional regulator